MNKALVVGALASVIVVLLVLSTLVPPPIKVVGGTSECAITVSDCTFNNSAGTVIDPEISFDAVYNCAGTANVCVQVQLFLLNTTTYQYDPVTSPSPMSGDSTTVTGTSTTLIFNGPTYEPPNHTPGQYKIQVTIYPVPCDQLETYTGQPLWSGSSTIVYTGS